MTKQVQRRRGTASQHTSFTGAEGEISVNTTNKSVHVHDGVTAGGVEAARADLANVSDASLNTALAGNTLSSLTITSADINSGTIDGTVIGGTTPAAVTATSLTATGTTTLAGASTTADITFGDNDKAIFGAGSDLQIYHDSASGQSIIHENGPSVLKIRATDFRLSNADNTADYLSANNGAEVSIRYNGAVKLATTSTGIDVTGEVQGDSLDIDGAADISGQVNFHSNVVWDDNNKLIIGNGSDLQIYHDGTHSRISDEGTGNLILKGSSAIVFSAVTNGEHGRVTDGGGWSLGYSGSQKLATTATGVDVTGTVTADGLTVDGVATLNRTNPILLLNETDTTDLNVGLNVSASTFNIGKYADAGNKVNDLLSIDVSTGDISFYEATGTTPKFFWDASAESLGIGTSSPATALDVLSGSSSVGALKVKNASGASASTPILEAINGGGNTRLIVLNDGSVGIGTSSITSNTILHLKDSDTQIELEATNGSNSAFIDFDGSNLQFSTNRNMINGAFSNTGKSNATITLAGPSGGSSIRMYTASSNNTVGSEAMRIDASGNLLVGTTSTAISNEGAVIFPSGVMTITNDGGRPLRLNRKTSDGDILQFDKDGTTVGVIGTINTDIFVGTGNTTLRYFDGGSDIRPAGSDGSARDNAIDLGDTNARFDDIYATNALIQTSDRNEKQDIAELDEAERRVAVAAKGLLRKFRWRDAVAEKGDDARIHFGIIAQDLQAAFAAEGLDAGKYAMFIHTTWTDEETGEERSRMGVRYSELLAFIIAAI